MDKCSGEFICITVKSYAQQLLHLKFNCLPTVHRARRSCHGGNTQLKYQRTMESVFMVADSVHAMSIQN